MPKIIIDRKSPRVTTFLGRINIIPGSHEYDLSPDDLAQMKVDDDFLFQIKRGDMKIVTEDATNLSADQIEEIAKTASLAELEGIEPRDLDADARKVLKAAIKARKAEIDEKKKNADEEKDSE